MGRLRRCWTLLVQAANVWTVGAAAVSIALSVGLAGAMARFSSLEGAPWPIVILGSALVLALAGAGLLMFVAAVTRWRSRPAHARAVTPSAAAALSLVVVQGCKGCRDTSLAGPVRPMEPYRELRVGLQNTGERSVESVSVWLEEMSHPYWHRLKLPRQVFGPQRVDPTGTAHDHVDLFARHDSSAHMTAHFADGDERIHYREYSGVLSIRAKDAQPRRYAFRLVRDPDDMFGLDSLELADAP